MTVKVENNVLKFNWTHLYQSLLPQKVEQSMLSLYLKFHARVYAF